MYTSIGSRWSIIASQLLGRTDNDIKNYWNTKLLGSTATAAPPHRAPRQQQHHHRPLNLMLQHSSSPSSLPHHPTYNGGFFPGAGGSLHDPSIMPALTLPSPHQDYSMLISSGLALHNNASSALLHGGVAAAAQLVKEESGSMIVFGGGDQQSCSSSDGGAHVQVQSQFGHAKELSFNGGYYGYDSNHGTTGSIIEHDHRLLLQLQQDHHDHLMRSGPDLSVEMDNSIGEWRRRSRPDYNCPGKLRLSD